MITSEEITIICIYIYTYKLIGYGGGYKKNLNLYSFNKYK